MTTDTLPKREWGPGPWQDEPDFARWTDRPTGLRCAIVRSDISGALGGYVEIDHPGLCRSVEELRFVFGAHGGIKYEGPLFEDETGWWVGFHCDEVTDVTPLLDALTARRPPSPLAQLVDALNGSMFSRAYRDIAYVRAQCGYLALQVRRASQVARGMR